MAQLTVGLDLGFEQLRRVRLHSSFRSVEVVDFLEVEIPKDDRPHFERLAEAVAALGGQAGQADVTATALPGSAVSVRTLELPFSDPKRIAQTVGFEIEGQIPFSLDEVVYDSLRVARTGQGVRMLAAVCPLEQMERWLKMLRDTGWDPALVGADCLAYSSLGEHLPTPEEGRAAILDIGQRLTSICIFGPEGVEFARTLSSGGLDMTQAIAQTFELDLARAEHAKREQGFLETDQRPALTPAQEQFSEVLKRTLSVLTRELRQTLATHCTLIGKSVSKIWLCGGGAEVDQLDTFLAEQLGLQVERLRPEHIAIEGIERLQGTETRSLTWIKALGLALHAHQGGRAGWLNLRRGPFAFKGDFSAFRGKMIQVGVGLLILALLGIGQVVVKYVSLSTTDTALNDRVRETTKAILGKPYDNIDIALNIVKTNTSPEADPLPRTTALKALYEIHARIPPELKVRFRSISISPTRIRLEGFADVFESITKIKESLEKYECFKEVQQGKGTKGKDGVEFELTIVNACERRSGA